MQATATSNSNNSTIDIINTISKKNDILGPWDPNNVNNKWPATIFAANRIERVIGRITFLIVSITTIIGIRKAGVPTGTKCAKRLLYCSTIE